MDIIQLRKKSKNNTKRYNMRKDFRYRDGGEGIAYDAFKVKY
ncbi:hypothetical protein [Tissierella praeacuta]